MIVVVERECGCREGWYDNLPPSGRISTPLALGQWRFLHMSQVIAVHSPEQANSWLGVRWGWSGSCRLYS